MDMNISLFVNFFAVTIFLLMFVVLFVVWRKIRYDKHRYQLFKLRDRLYQLVLSGKIDKNDNLFLKTESVICSSISTVEKYDLYTLLKLLEYYENLEEKQKKSHKTLMDKILENKELSEIYKSHTEQILTIMKENSLFIRVFLVLIKMGIIQKLRVKNRRAPYAMPTNVYLEFNHWRQKFA